jgi:hypothetical protein
MTGVVLLYLGLILIGVCVLSLFVRWSWRGRAFLAGLALVAAGLFLPAREIRATETLSRLDGIAPVWQFDEFHRTHTSASCREAWTAIKSVTAGEIRAFRTLTWIRRFGKPGPESILNPPANAPILAVATRTGFRLLAEEVEREVVIGAALPPRRETKAYMNFQLTEAPTGGCEVTTETRVNATTKAARQRFAMYWRVIYPGSALIRRMWLAAIRERAEKPS